MSMAMGKESIEQTELLAVCVGHCQKFDFLADPVHIMDPTHKGWFEAPAVEVQLWDQQFLALIREGMLQWQLQELCRDSLF